MLETCKRGVTAGYLIGLSAYIYAACENKTVGAFLFGLGLLTICAFKLYLFTGKVGESKPAEILQCSLIFIMNAIGVVVAVLLLKWSPWRSFSAGVACGSLMQMGVSLYSKHPWATVMCVAAFLLSDSKHCIAMLYTAEPESLLWWAILSGAIVGNIFGAKIVALGGVKKEVKS